MKDIANFIYELGSARRILRSHKQFIGTSDESISDHTFRVMFISLILSKYYEEVNREKLLIMALIHDIAEIRTGDLNPVNKKYCKVNESEAFKDQTKVLGKLGEELQSTFQEYITRKSIESKIVKDADILDQIALQREYDERGVSSLSKWHSYQINLLELEESKEISKSLLSTSSFDWLHIITSIK